jgi:hypothetical protein
LIAMLRYRWLGSRPELASLILIRNDAMAAHLLKACYRKIAPCTSQNVTAAKAQCYEQIMSGYGY